MRMIHRIAIVLWVTISHAWSSGLESTQSPELNGSGSERVSQCTYFGYQQKCSICYITQDGALSQTTDYGCLAFNPPVSTPDLSKYDNSAYPGHLGSQSWQISPQVANTLMGILSYFTGPDPLDSANKSMDALIFEYENQMRQTNEALLTSARARQAHWQKLEPELQEKLRNTQEKLANFNRHISDLSLQLGSLKPHESQENPSEEAALLNRALSRQGRSAKVAKGIPAENLSPDSVSLLGLYDEAFKERTGVQESRLQSKVRQERARLRKVSESSLRLQAEQALTQAERFSSMSGISAQETTEKLLKEARSLRRQADEKLQLSEADLLSEWLLSFQKNPNAFKNNPNRFSASPEAIAARARATQALAEQTLATLDSPIVTAHLEQKATEYLRNQTQQAQSLAASASRIAFQSGSMSRLAEALGDLAYASVKSVHDFTTGLASGVYQGFYDLTQATQLIFTQPGTWQKITHRILQDLTDPPQFIRHALEPWLDYVRTLQTGTAQEAGRASGKLLSQVLIGLALASPTGAVTESAVQAIVPTLEGLAVSEAAGQNLAGRFHATPVLSRVSSGALIESAEVATYVEKHPALRALPSHLQPKRVLVGTMGRDEKVALIGRSMEGGVNDTARLLRANGMEVKTFEWSDVAKTEFAEIKKGTPNGWLNSEQIRSTLAYDENKKWVEGLLKEGYTILDIGNPTQNPLPSEFYSMELENVFRKGTLGL